VSMKIFFLKLISEVLYLQHFPFDLYHIDIHTILKVSISVLD
jgi:hypothetical protein